MKITMIGAGNVANHLALGLYERGHEIKQIFSRNLGHAKELADKISVPFTNVLSNIDTTSDLYIIAISDDAIKIVVEQLSSIRHKFICHTSGATPSTVFKAYFKRYGVFYPLQSFSKNKSANWGEIPFCISANQSKDQQILYHLATQFSSHVYPINDRERAVLHVAAVFVNNFSNYLYHVSETILENEQIPFDILKPLIQETVNKLENGKAVEMQTGPAIRNDEHTINRHINYLERYHDFQLIYQLLTKKIQQIKNRK